MKKRELLKSLGMGPGDGAEVTLQTTIASEVVPLIRQQSFVRQIADDANALINMTKPKLRVPRMRRAQGVYGVKAGQPAPEFKARLDGIDLVPQKLMAWLPIDQELFEDSTIRNFEGMLKEEMAREFAQGEEAAWLLGDTSQNFGDGDPRNLFDGLIKQASGQPHVYDDTLDNVQDTVLTSNLIRAMQNLGIYGRNKRDVVIMVGLNAEEALLRSRSFQTQSAYAFGSGAGIFSGEVGRLAGATVIATTYLDPQPGDTYGKAFVMNKSCFAIGDWSNFTVNVFNEILSQVDQVAIRARERVAFTVRYPWAIVNIENFPKNPSDALAGP
ncbi:MAG: phage major capsid protein [Candidatus Bipolaricaulia bacterium]